MLFRFSFVTSTQGKNQENIFKNILNIVQPFANTKNPDLLRVRQKILLELGKLGSSFVRSDSNASSRTVARLRTNQDKIMNTLPKQCGARPTPKSVINEFIEYLDGNDNSEFADSGTRPVITAKGVKSPVKHLTKPVDTLIYDYTGFKKHQQLKVSKKYKKKLRSPQPKRSLTFNSRSNLKKHIPLNYKKSKRHTGRCPLCKEHVSIGKTLMGLCDHEWIFPLHGQCIDIPTKEDIEDMVDENEISKFNSLLDRYLALDMHIRLRIRIRRL